MMRVAYLANRFPSDVEPYVGDEIAELRLRGVHVVACTIWRGKPDGQRVLQVLDWSPVTFCKVLFLMYKRRRQLADFLERLQQGNKSFTCRIRALLHTLLGAILAVRLLNRGIQHIHVHHGYFAAWVAMVAARFLGISYSLTLHGSDLLLGAPFLDTKLEHCRFCVTISEYNRNFLLRSYPQISPEKVSLNRMGVRIPPRPEPYKPSDRFRILTVGRLHPVKNQEFLIRACARLKELGIDFQCQIAGEGPERGQLSIRIRDLALQHSVELVGHIPRQDLDSLYSDADLVVLTSKSEGIPLTLMEAMSHGCIVLAPRLTGIPELVVEGTNGFLYDPGSLESFLEALLLINKTRAGLDWIRMAARQHVIAHFNRAQNLSKFADIFIAKLRTQEEIAYADSVLQ